MEIIKTDYETDVSKNQRERMNSLISIVILTLSIIAILGCTIEILKNK